MSVNGVSDLHPMDRLEGQVVSSDAADSDNEPDSRPTCVCVKLSQYIKSQNLDHGLEIIGLLMCLSCGVFMQHVV